MYKFNLTREQVRVIFIAIGVIILGIILWFSVIQISRIGKISVDIETSPQKNVIVKIDGKKVTSGTNYITAGDHTFSAEKDGFDKAEQTVNVSKVNNYVALLPNAVSADAQEEISDPEESAHAQTISGIASQRLGEAFQQNNPITAKLPYTDISAPYEIDYGYNEDDNSRIYLIVSFSSSQGRKKAIKWLQDNNVDTTKTEVVFNDFINSARVEGHD